MLEANILQILRILGVEPCWEARGVSHEDFCTIGPSEDKQGGGQGVYEGYDANISR